MTAAAAASNTRHVSSTAPTSSASNFNVMEAAFIPPVWPPLHERQLNDDGLARQYPLK